MFSERQAVACFSGRRYALLLAAIALQMLMFCAAASASDAASRVKIIKRALLGAAGSSGKVSSSSGAALRGNARHLTGMGTYGGASSSSESLRRSLGALGGHNRALIEQLMQHRALGAYPGERRSLIDELMSAPAYGASSPPPPPPPSPAIPAEYEIGPPYDPNPYDPNQAPVLPEGQCYCQYDSDWEQWSLQDPVCRAALYQRAASRTYLDKSWLDAYYGYKPPAGSGAVLDPPYHKEISTFLYADCIPTPPCSCTGLTPEQPGTQDTQSACFHEVFLYGTDVNRIVPRAVLAAATSQSPAHVGVISSWVAEAFSPEQCEAYSGQQYTLVLLPPPPAKRSLRSVFAL